MEAALWVDASDAAGSIATAVGVIGGVVIAILYSRKATATVSAEAVVTNSGTLVSVRPSIYALGPFKLKFADSDGAVVRVTPVLATESDGTRSDEVSSKKREAFPADETGRPQFVSPGETLTSSLLFRVGLDTPGLIGWSVSLNIASKGFLRHGLHWADRVFVPMAPSRSGGQNPEQQE
jgi:hypothetical protein